MKRLAIFLATCCAASAAFAANDIVKCVDPAGHVTLTDQPCRGGDDTVLLPSSTSLPAAVAAAAPPGLAVTHIVTSERVQAPARAAVTRHDSWAANHAPGRALARDVATLKAAHASLQAMDGERSAHLAGLN